ncbi:YVTN family beta-propeller protein [Motilibacter rhizosphaerae]|uniref:YVTN family beta-propeller protein n=1 Tax=Motilibacter rhizosphaerae TaxID=598652 RepID=A0A4V2F3C9_9ACTN|nr:alkaline phosphatase family protein [Motilibacter rhizosphaerae]RZS82673.1 YVTN family beta-propeller protein [Motilibacter rhizosphaerae]
MQVTRRHVPVVRPSFVKSRRVRLLVASTAALAVAGSGVAYGATTIFDHNQVGTVYANGEQVSADQVLKPYGDRLVTPYGKFMASTVSPDGRFLAATSTDRSVSLQIFDLSTYQLVWRAGSAAGVNQKLKDNTVGQEAPTFSPDGSVLWMPNATGLTRFPVNADGSLGTPTTVAIPDVDGKNALVAGSVYSADGKTLYVAANGQNRVVAIDAAAGTVGQSWPVGIAPRQIALVGSKLYVSDEGGRQATAGDTTMDSYGTPVPADGYKGTSTTGALSVIDTSAPSAAVGSIAVGLHPTAITVSGGALFVTNTNDDTVSVVNTATDTVVQTINAQPWAGSPVGYQPNGISLTKDGHILVTLGRANAVAVYKYNGTPQAPVDFVGLLPTDYYPSNVTEVGGKVVVTNTRGIDARGPELTFKQGTRTPAVTGHGTHSTTASLTRFTLPDDATIASETATVYTQNGWARANRDVERSKGGDVKAEPVPRRLGDPSTIKHVFLLVKENRTYDQVYGDIAKGNGDASLAQFGQQVTPNQHALANAFGLYDNTYDIGTNSAEGHNWLMQGDNPEYTETSAGEYIRSYDTEEDVLGHQRSGFLWTNVQDAGNTAKNYGEFLYTEGRPTDAGATWQNYYCAAKSVDQGGDPSQLFTPDLAGDYHSVIPSLDAITNHTSPPFDLSIPDLYRYEVWKQDFEKNGPAAFNMMWLSSDHTGGPASPRAMVADGDLAVGKVVDEISHSKYWKDSAIFVVEDDSQAGADHVDGHRAPIQIISPWAKKGYVDSTFYSQITMVRTIEQILGATPLNQRLAAATPMFNAFKKKKPDLTPFDAVPNQIPLTEDVKDAPACGNDTLGTTGAAATQVSKASASRTAVPASAASLAAQWEKWKSAQTLTGNGARADSAAPELMNRYTWYATHGWTVAYPGDSKVYAPSQVPGGTIPSADGD